MEISKIHSLYLTCHSIVIDTRKIVKNSLFVALKGERFDANTFASEALEKGASYVLIDDSFYYVDDRTILVENTLSTLQELAKFHRNFLGIPIVALTGSNGKTTTKELINVVLSKKFNTKATIGNLNNHIGVPLTLLSFDKSNEIGIVEMGANHQKEIEFLCQIAQPDFGYITNFGKAHLEGFGGVEGVIKGKSEMYDYLKLHNKQVFVNLDDPIQNEKTTSLDRITFSQKNNDSFLFIQDITANPFVIIKFNEIEVYQTTLTSQKITQQLDAIMFFSPSGVESYLQKNKIKKEICFCIGETTAKALEEYTENIVVAEYPSVEAVIEEVINEFS